MTHDPAIGTFEVRSFGFSRKPKGTPELTNPPVYCSLQHGATFVKIFKHSERKRERDTRRDRQTHIVGVNLLADPQTGFRVLLWSPFNAPAGLAKDQPRSSQVNSSSGSPRTGPSLRGRRQAPGARYTWWLGCCFFRGKAKLDFGVSWWFPFETRKHKRYP